MIAFDHDSWRWLPVFNAGCAGPTDVEAGRAVFALGETYRPRVLPMDLPQPVIWWAEDEQRAAVAVQGEAHETEDGQTLEVLGLILPDGETALVMLEDVDMVDPTDPVWIDLLDAETEADEDDAWDDDDDVS